MLGMGPIIWEQVQESQGRTYSEPAPWPRQGSETRVYSGHYYRAIDAIDRGDRLVCTCDVMTPRHDVTGKRFTKMKAFP